MLVIGSHCFCTIIICNYHYYNNIINIILPTDYYNVILWRAGGAALANKSLPWLMGQPMRMRLKDPERLGQTTQAFFNDTDLIIDSCYLL